MTEETPVFGPFGQLQFEIKSLILSFVADAPFEQENCSESSLTHSLPFVSSEFREIANSDEIWEDALKRRIESEPLWMDAINQLAGGTPSESTTQTLALQLIQQAKTSLRITTKELYSRIVNEFIRFRSPVFAMRTILTIGEPYGLHLFEPRYRVLVAEVMRHQPASAREGGAMDPSRPPPLFIHAHLSPFAPNTPAMTVRILRCEVYPGGQADVILLPVSLVWLETIRVRQNAGHLFEATAIHMGKEASDRILHNA